MAIKSFAWCSSAGNENLIDELCARHGISESGFHDWREIARTGATHALAEHAARKPP